MGNRKEVSEKTNNKTTNLPRDNTLKAMPKAVVLAAGEIWEDMNRNMLKQQRVFRISGNNRGLTCPFKPMLFQEGYCTECQVYPDWQKRGEILVICAWCGKKIRRNLVMGQQEYPTEFVRAVSKSWKEGGSGDGNRKSYCSNCRED